ncbi:hypothetical protein SRABI106_02149 [Rahnella aquatilis]|nr:hypothetical protein SRABI106_02149 [Rahnella aquatilis]
MDVFGLGQTDFLLAALTHTFDTLLALVIFGSNRECLLLVTVPDSLANKGTIQPTNNDFRRIMNIVINQYFIAVLVIQFGGVIQVIE